MVVDEAVYLEHYGKKGMHWGQRRAAMRANRTLNKSHSKAQKAAVVVASVGAAFLANKIMVGRTLNVKTGALAGITAGVATKKFVDNVINSKGNTKLSSLAK